MHSLIEGFREWSEGCACHDVLSDLDMHEKELLKYCSNGECLDECVLKGLRAPEMAAGDWQRVLDKLLGIQLRCRALRPRVLRCCGGWHGLDTGA
eukprot:5281273-Pyramimonas_sp.AAC.1